MMAFASSIHTSMAVQCLSSSLRHRLFVGQPGPTRLILPRHPQFRSVLALARRRNPSSSTTGSSSSKKKRVKKSLPRKDAVGEDDLDDDAFEALFSQLEEDLKNDDPSLGDGDEEISEEDLARLEQELAEVLGDVDMGMLNSAVDDTESDKDAEEEDDNDDEEEQKPVKLRNWQLRRLASALRTGRVKLVQNDAKHVAKTRQNDAKHVVVRISIWATYICTEIKTLAAELCLDRAVVLELLRDPPPNLLMMSAALPDVPASTVSVSVPETKPMESNHSETSVDAAEPSTKVQEPVHVMQHRWSALKRLKKVQVETLERVYRRTKRPTNAMISSIVHVTNLPRKRVVKWFEDKRSEEGVPDNRLPYQRSVPESV